MFPSTSRYPFSTHHFAEEHWKLVPEQQLFPMCVPDHGLRLRVRIHRVVIHHPFRSPKSIFNHARARPTAKRAWRTASFLKLALRAQTLRTKWRFSAFYDRFASLRIVTNTFSCSLQGFWATARNDLTRGPLSKILLSVSNNHLRTG